MAVRSHPRGEKKPGARHLIEHDWFVQEIAFGQKLLGLDDWDLSVVTVPKLRDDEGNCEPHEGHLTCVMTFRQDPIIGEAMYNVYHELGHLLFVRWKLACNAVLDEDVPSSITKQSEAAIEKGMEDAIERFAHTIVRLLPDRKEPNG